MNAPNLSMLRRDEKKAEQERKGQFVSALLICRKLQAYKQALQKARNASSKPFDQTPISDSLKVEACGNAMRSLSDEIRRQHPQLSALQSMDVAAALAGNSALSLSTEQINSLGAASRPFFPNPSRLAQQTQKLVRAALDSTVAAIISKIELEGQLLPSRETIEKQAEALKDEKSRKADALDGEIKELEQKKAELARQVEMLRADVGRLEVQKQQQLAAVGALQGEPLAKLLANHAILVVEDDMASQEYVVRLLINMGISKNQIIATDDPRKALKMASDFSDEGVPMLVLLDYALPHNMTGGQVASELHKDKGARAKIVGMTAFKGIKEVNYGDPEIAVLTKPFDRKEFAHAIYGTLAKSKN